MTDFSISRFGKIIRWEAATMYKEILSKTAAMFFAFMVPFVIHLLSGYNATDESLADSLLVAFITNQTIFIVIAAIGGSWIFSNMKTKEQRVMFKTLPASDLEKFVVRALYVTLVWWCMAVVAFCMADLLRMLICLITGVDVVKCLIPELLSSIFSFNAGNVGGVRFGDVLPDTAVKASVYGFIFWVYSLYILGGTLFRRHQFVMTSVVYSVIGLLGMLLLFNVLDGTDKATVILMIDVWLWTFFALTVAVGVFNWWLSYRIFRRMQVINNKWINL